MHSVVCLSMIQFLKIMPFLQVGLILQTVPEPSSSVAQKLYYYEIKCVLLKLIDLFAICQAIDISLN